MGRWFLLMVLCGGCLVSVASAAVEGVKAGLESGIEKGVNESDMARGVLDQFLKALRAGDRNRVDRLLVVPSEDRLRDKLSLAMTRRMELMAGHDLYEEVLEPGRVREGWGLFVTLQRQPKADRNKVKLSSVLLYRDEGGVWKVVPKIVFSDLSLNVSHDADAQALLRWYRNNERRWTEKFVAPLLSENGMPDAMRHMATAPQFDLDRLRDPFASYIALITKHQEKVLQDRREKANARPKEPLEAFDLSSLRLVAIYAIHGQQVAMVEDNEGTGHTVRVGDYMGKYNGKVTAIDASGVHLLEEMINPKGKLEHKETLLALPEDKESK